MPNGLQQLVLADDPIAVSDQEQKQIQNLRLDLHKRRAVPQLSALRIEDAGLKVIHQ